ncbi:hypothetical protein [Antrihabitans cavernicola]|uniref:hypothetical protein n=1 Tax=Antrihabitans cavernicola TaxID=2495913 RepID=UPI001F3DCD72|nr:hypothetical protein [Spelaeibacter cavernicola]
MDTSLSNSDESKRCASTARAGSHFSTIEMVRMPFFAKPTSKPPIPANKAAAVIVELLGVSTSGY